MWYILTYSAVNKTYVKITNGVKLQYASYKLEFFKINENIQITIVETTSKTRVFKRNLFPPILEKINLIFYTENEVREFFFLRIIFC